MIKKKYKNSFKSYIVGLFTKESEESFSSVDKKMIEFRDATSRVQPSEKFNSLVIDQIFSSISFSGAGTKVPFSMEMIKLHREFIFIAAVTLLATAVSLFVLRPWKETQLFADESLFIPDALHFDDGDLMW